MYKISKTFSFHICKDILRVAESHNSEAEAAPWPTIRTSFRYQHCNVFNLFSVASVILDQVPAPLKRLGIHTAYHSNKAVSIPPHTRDLQSFTTWEISSQVPRIFPSLCAKFPNFKHFKTFFQIKVLIKIFDFQKRIASINL